jgi:hypothetical protein
LLLRQESTKLHWPFLICLIAVGFPAPDLAQKPSPPPDFGQSSLITASEQASKAWDSWEKSNADLEQLIFSLPMVEARDRIQHALSDFLGYLDQRRLYCDSVATYIESYRLNLGSKSSATIETVSGDQLQVLGVSLIHLQNKLEALRATSAWAQIRRSVQQERSDVLALQSSRRDEITVDRPLDRSRPVAHIISPIIYRDSERQLSDALQKLWARYYQSLVDGVEQKPAGSAPLLTRLPANTAPLAFSAAPNPASNAAVDSNPLLGTWTYRDSSHQFNGVAEPRQVMLELWMEQGLLLGRYRAELPAFDGTTRHVDLRLRGRITPGHDQTLDFRSTDPDVNGRVVIEGPGSTGLELMFVRLVESGSPIPRGRESLTRR